MREHTFTRRESAGGMPAGSGGRCPCSSTLSRSCSIERLVHGSARQWICKPSWGRDRSAGAAAHGPWWRFLFPQQAGGTASGRGAAPPRASARRRRRLAGGILFFDTNSVFGAARCGKLKAGIRVRSFSVSRRHSRTWLPSKDLGRPVGRGALRIPPRSAHHGSTQGKPERQDRRRRPVLSDGDGRSSAMAAIEPWL